MSDENFTLENTFQSLLNMIDLNVETTRERDAAIEERDAAIAERDRLREALKGWQDWWELPWLDRRPDIANLRHMKARAALDALDGTEPR